MKLLAIILIPLVLVSCAGYQMGGSKPSHLEHVKTITVPLFKNDTLLIRADSHATNSAVDALTRDGTYRVATASTADAVLEGRISEVDYSQVSSSRTDTLSSEELSMQITIAWILRDAKNPKLILQKGLSHGSTRFFARGNLHVARTNALPDALRRATESMTTQLADGF